VNYLVDTCVISELLKTRPNRKVVDWLAGVPENTLYLSVLTIGELSKGVAKLPRSARQTRLQRWIEQDLMQRFSGRILVITEETALAWGRIVGASELAGRPLSVIDSLLVATANVQRMALVTRNVQDVEGLGVPVINPFA
jgi:predicted nucleic acid-binding protein